MCIRDSFTPWDHNWPFGPPEDAEEPDAEVEAVEEDEDEPCIAFGSIIECENQILGEEISIVGTPFSLVYRSDRAPGRTRSLARQIRLSGATVPESLKRIELEVAVAGKVYQEAIVRLPGHPASHLANRTVAFSWDGRDAYGRIVEGTHEVAVTIRYVYDAVYYPVEAQAQRAFARFPTTTSFSPQAARGEITIDRRFHDVLVALDARTIGLGGWTIDAHHRLDSTGRRVDFGYGARRSSRYASPVLVDRIGGGTLEADGAAASQAEVRYPTALAAGADGSIYVGQVDSEYGTGGPGFGLALVRRVLPDGSIHG
jgi:hypothetical protein